MWHHTAHCNLSVYCVPYSTVCTYVHTYIQSYVFVHMLSCVCWLGQLEEYKRRCTDLEAEIAVQEIGAESNTQQVGSLTQFVHRSYSYRTNLTPSLVVRKYLRMYIHTTENLHVRTSTSSTDNMLLLVVH